MPKIFNFYHATPELFMNSAVTTKEIEDVIFREQINKLCSDLPMEELAKIFQLKKIDPFSEESEKILNGHFEDEYKKDKIMTLRYKNVVEFQVWVDIK